jgi:hypothetical protein
MAKKKNSLRAGIEAEADILTKMIRPKVAVPHKDHRSRVVLIDRVEEKGKYRFTFHFVGADETQFNGSAQYVSIIKEGDPLLFFSVIETNNNNNNNNNNDKFKEPEIGWAKSRARKLLYMDVKTGMVPLDAMVDRKRTTDNKDVFIMHEEYASWSYKKFSSRLAGIRRIIKTKNGRAEDDQKAFDKFVENNEVSTVSHKGYIQWQGSDAQRLLKKDIKDGTLEKYTKENYPKNHKMQFWLTRPEYYDEFPLPVFRDKIRQEIGSAKYIHTLKVRGKQATYKYN